MGGRLQPHDVRVHRDLPVEGVTRAVIESDVNRHGGGWGKLLLLLFFDLLLLLSSHAARDVGFGILWRSLFSKEKISLSDLPSNLVQIDLDGINIVVKAHFPDVFDTGKIKPGQE